MHILICTSVAGMKRTEEYSDTAEPPFLHSSSTMQDLGTLAAPKAAARVSTPAAK